MIICMVLQVGRALNAFFTILALIRFGANMNVNMVLQVGLGLKTFFTILALLRFGANMNFNMTLQDGWGLETFFTILVLMWFHAKTLKGARFVNQVLHNLKINLIGYNQSSNANLALQHLTQKLTTGFVFRNFIRCQMEDNL